MSTTKQEFLTPVGRLVQGDPFEKQTKNMNGQPLVTQSGQPTQKYFVGVAFAKTDAAFGAFYQLLVNAARQGFPQLFNAQGECVNRAFSWKLVDGDGVDTNGQPNNRKEGFAGHWVVRFQSSFPPKCYYAGRYQPHEQIKDPNVIRRGYYVRVSGTIEPNANPQKPGLYVNLNMVELAAQGVEIVSGPDAGAVFGAAPVANLPAGATALPGNGGAPQMPAMPGMPQMPQMPQMPAMPQQPAAPQMPAMPAMPVMPNPAFAAGPGAPAMPGMPQMPAPPQAPQMPAPPPAGPQLTAAWPAGFTYAQMTANGWTDPALRQAGFIL